MSTRTLIVALVTLVLVSWAIYYRQEIPALVWHARHGFHAEINGIKVPVPLFYRANSDGVSNLTLRKFGGTVQPGGGFIMVSFFPRPSPEAEQRVEELMAKKGFTRTTTRVGERTVTFAGRSGTCIEFTQKIVNRLADGVDCRFGDVNVEFGGSANLKDDFYTIIESAQPVPRKN